MNYLIRPSLPDRKSWRNYMINMRSNTKIARTVGIVIGMLFAVAIYAAPQRVDEHRYRVEIKRFDKVVNEASDEELFLMLRVAIYHNFVPLRMIDPYYDMHYATSPWFKTGKIYRKLSGRRDLLEQIYPDQDRLDEYVLSQHSGIWREDIRAMQDTIMQNLASDSLLLDSIYNHRSEREGLMRKYFPR